MTLIRNSKQAKQGLDFAGVENGKIHPTDIDAVLEFDNEALILIEVKKENNAIPTGQRLVLERICNSWHTYKSIVLHVTHNFTNDNVDIPLAECRVETCYFKGVWHNINERPALIKLLNTIGKRWNIEKLKI